MKRGILVMAALLAWAGLGWADYVVIRINLAAGGGRVPTGEEGAEAPAAPDLSEDAAARLRGGFPALPAYGAAPIPGQEGAPEKPAEKFSGFMVVVEADQATWRGKNYLEATHKWGRTLLVDIPGIIEMRVDKSPPLWSRLQKERQRLQDKEGSTQLSVASTLRLAEWMLQHWNLPAGSSRVDMQRDFEAELDKMAKADRTKLDPASQKKVEALLAAREHIRKPLELPSQELTALLQVLPSGGEYGEMKTDHYVMLHRDRDSRLAEQKLRRLERVYAGFFYWFALQGQPLSPPAQKLVAVLAEDGRSFRQIHDVFDNQPFVVDGFYSPFDRVAVFAATRVDNPFQQLQGMLSAIERQGLDRKQLLEGRFLDARPGKEMTKKMGEKGYSLAIYGGMLALAREAAMEEGEIATVSHEGGPAARRGHGNPTRQRAST
jgi:hypothetical protein